MGLSCAMRVLIRSSVIPLTKEERNSADIKEMKKSWMRDLLERLKDRGDGIKVDSEESEEKDDAYIHPLEEDGETPMFERYEDDAPLKDGEEIFENPPSEEADQVDFDKYVGVNVCKNLHGIDKFGVIRGRKRRRDGGHVGVNTIYEIEWHDGEIDAYCANEVIEAMLMNVDAEGNDILHLKEFVDHKKDASAVHADDGFINVNGKHVWRQTTKGWTICAKILGGETEWMDLKTAKEAYPVQVAEYAVANKLVSEPVFAWWVAVLKAVKRRALSRKTKKFGLEVPGPGPQVVKRAYEVDAKTGTNHWAVAMEKDVKMVLPALRILEVGKRVPPGFMKIDLMTVFDVKMDLTRKARICAQGDQTHPHILVTYASVVTHKSIHLGFLLAALNHVNILSADIAGAYLNVKCAEKIYTVLGAEFGDLQGRTATVEKALYGLWSSGYENRS